MCSYNIRNKQIKISFNISLSSHLQQCCILLWYLLFFIDSYNYFIIIIWQPLWLEEEASIRIILCRKSLWCVKLVSAQ